jgi:hypothetical protein
MKFLTASILLLLGLTVVSQAKDLQCQVPGICGWPAYAIGNDYTEELCLMDCKSDPKCQWISFGDTICFWFDSCPEILEQDGCDSCKTSQKDCENI